MRWLLWLVVVALSGCTTTKVIEREVPVTEVRTEYVVRNARDSVYMHDSVYVDRGRDTVLIERWHTRWRDRLRVDTLVVRDSIEVPVEVVREVVRTRCDWWWMAINLCGCVVCAIIFFLKIRTSCDSC